VLIESGGDNLTATFSYGLVDTQIFVIDVAGGDKVPRKGGPGITLSDLLVINKTDLAPLVHADLDVMQVDTVAARGERPFTFLSLSDDPGAAPVVNWVRGKLASIACPSRAKGRGPGLPAHLGTGRPARRLPLHARGRVLGGDGGLTRRRR